MRSERARKGGSNSASPLGYTPQFVAAQIADCHLLQCWRDPSNRLSSCLRLLGGPLDHDRLRFLCAQPDVDVSTLLVDC
jgi:hypothetical protein